MATDPIEQLLVDRARSAFQDYVDANEELIEYRERKKDGEPKSLRTD